MSSQLWGFQLNHLKISISYSCGLRFYGEKFHFFVLFWILISEKMVATSSLPFLFLRIRKYKNLWKYIYFFLWKFLKRDVRKNATTWCILPRSANIGGTVNSIEMTHWMQISLIFNAPLFLDVNLKYLTVNLWEQKHGKIKHKVSLFLKQCSAWSWIDTTNW